MSKKKKSSNIIKFPQDNARFMKCSLCGKNVMATIEENPENSPLSFDIPNHNSRKIETVNLCSHCSKNSDKALYEIMEKRHSVPSNISSNMLEDIYSLKYKDEECYKIYESEKDKNGIKAKIISRIIEGRVSSVVLLEKSKNENIVLMHTNMPLLSSEFIESLKVIKILLKHFFQFKIKLISTKRAKLETNPLQLKCFLYNSNQDIVLTFDKKTKQISFTIGFVSLQFNLEQSVKLMHLLAVSSKNIKKVLAGGLDDEAVKSQLLELEYYCKETDMRLKLRRGHNVINELYEYFYIALQCNNIEIDFTIHDFLDFAYTFNLFIGHITLSPKSQNFFKLKVARFLHLIKELQMQLEPNFELLKDLGWCIHLERSEK